MELELGVLLFQRHARGVKVTPAGRRMLPFSARISRLLSDAKAAARDDGIPSGVLEVGTLETTAALRLPSVLASFTKAYPKVRPVVTTGTTCSLIEDVVECRLEGAFVAGPVDHPDLQQESVFREELVLVTPRSIRGIEDLSSITELKTIVFRIGCSYRIRLDNLLNKAGILVAQPLEFGSIDAILGCVAAGVGITCCPRVSSLRLGGTARSRCMNWPPSLPKYRLCLFGAPTLTCRARSRPSLGLCGPTPNCM